MELDEHPKFNKLIYTSASVDARNYDHSAFEDSLLKELPSKVGTIDLRYISQRPALTSDGTQNLAGRVEAAVRLCCQIGALLNVLQPEIDQSLAECYRKTRGPDRAEPRQEDQERPSEKS